MPLVALSYNVRRDWVQFGGVRIIEILEVGMEWESRSGFLAKMASLSERSEWIGLQALGAPRLMFIPHHCFWRLWVTRIMVLKPLQEDQCFPEHISSLNVLSKY